MTEIDELRRDNDLLRRERDRLKAIKNAEKAAAKKEAKERAKAEADGAEALDLVQRLLWSRPGFLIRRLLQIHNGLFFEECGGWNLTPLQYGILTILSGKSEGLDVRSLAAELGVSETTIRRWRAMRSRKRSVSRARCRRFSGPRRAKSRSAIR